MYCYYFHSVDEETKTQAVMPKATMGAITGAMAQI